jgi:hypothetical protein
MLIPKDKFEDGLIIKKKCVDLEEFIAIYKDTDNDDIKAAINEIMDSYFYRVRNTISEFAIFFDMVLNCNNTERAEDYNWCCVSDFFKMRELIYEDWFTLMTDYDFSKTKDSYWKFVDFDIEKMWKDEPYTKYLPSLETIIETDFVSETMINYTKSIQNIWTNLPNYF